MIVEATFVSLLLAIAPLYTLYSEFYLKNKLKIQALENFIKKYNFNDKYKRYTPKVLHPFFDHLSKLYEKHGKSFGKKNIQEKSQCKKGQAKKPARLQSKGRLACR